MTPPPHRLDAPVPLVYPEGAPESAPRPLFSVATLVTDMAQYEAMRASFAARGFTAASTEFLFIDNQGPTQTCAYRGLNAALNAARGDYVILCHQDVRLLADGLEELVQRLAGLDARDPAWALAGNAGGVGPGVLALCITDPHGAGQKTANFPARVVSLDENFIVVKRAARIGFSSDMSGFHFYGADICLNAGVAGRSAYVIDFHLAHLSAGNKSADFYAMQDAFRAKWSRALSARWLQTTCALVRLSGDPAGRLAGRLTERPYAKLARHLARLRA